MSKTGSASRIKVLSPETQRSIGHVFIHLFKPHLPTPRQFQVRCLRVYQRDVIQIISGASINALSLNDLFPLRSDPISPTSC